jgi:hypothetical protein
VNNSVSVEYGYTRTAPSGVPRLVFKHYVRIFT